MAAAIPAAGIVAGLIENEKNRKSARSAQDAAQWEAEMARRQTQPIIDRQLALFDTIRGIVDGAKAQGQFNPAWMISQLNQDHNRNLGQTTGALSAAMRNMGYRPGDSEVGVRMDATMGKAQIGRDQQATQLRRDLFMDQLSAYSAVPGNALNSAAAMINQGADRNMGLQAGLSNMYASRIQNPAGFFAALMPFLQQKKNDQGQQNQDKGQTDTGIYNPDGPQNDGPGTPPVVTTSSSFFDQIFPYFNPYDDMRNMA